MQTNASASQCVLTHPSWVVSVLPPLLIIELLLGLPGNVIALWVFCHHLQSWTPNIVFLFCLALADFLLLVSLPFQIHYLLQEEDWGFGNVLCQINLFMIAVNRSASIAFMTTVAVDRYFKIVHPHHKVNFISSHQAAGTACFIWVMVILLRVPLLTNNFLKKVRNVSLCQSFYSFEVLPPVFLIHYIVYIAEFFLPLVPIVFCSIRITCTLCRRQKVKKNVKQAICTVLVIVGIFLICFFPGVATGLTVLYLKNLKGISCKVYTMTVDLFRLSIGFTYLNSALDPLIYCFSSSMFQNEIKGAISRLTLVELQNSEQSKEAKKVNGPERRL